MTKPSLADEPSLSTENTDNTNEKTSIWASILRDVKSSTKKAPATKSLIVLGDNESGRTTLIAKLQGNDDPKRGAGLEYHYIDVKDDDRDDTPKLGVWILDGDVACSAPLLKFALKPETVENTIILLVASMTQPWALLSTLKKWATLIEEHLDRLKLDPTRLREMRDRFQYEFQHYTEPNDPSTMLTSSSSSTTIKSSTSRIPNSVSSVSLASTTTMSPTTADEQVVLPLPDGVLTKSLGITIIVVITKCDAMASLEKEHDYKDEHFDFMQHHLRKFCLEYGAALFYTSVKEKKNIDKLYKYIVHKCYGYPFSYPAAIVDRDAIFIPSGWDNPKKADILLENLHRLKANSNYSDVFVKPVLRRPLQRDNEIISAEDDQEFLAKLQSTLNRASSPGRTEENATPVLTRTSAGSGTSGSQTPTIGARPRAQPMGAAAGAGAATNEGALANFFNSLLTRKSAGPMTPTTNASNAQRTTPVAQSPTTPSRRSAQHPLTFAVTPPARTRTPTSQRTFPANSNLGSPSKSLSPIVDSPTKTIEHHEQTPVALQALVPNQHLDGPADVKSDRDVLKSPSELTQISKNETDVTQDISVLADHPSLSNESSHSHPNDESHATDLTEQGKTLHDPESSEIPSNDRHTPLQSPINDRTINGTLPSPSGDRTSTEPNSIHDHIPTTIKNNEESENTDESEMNRQPSSQADQAEDQLPVLSSSSEQPTTSIEEENSSFTETPVQQNESAPEQTSQTPALLSPSMPTSEIDTLTETHDAIVSDEQVRSSSPGTTQEQTSSRAPSPVANSPQEENRLTSPADLQHAHEQDSDAEMNDGEKSIARRSLSPQHDIEGTTDETLHSNYRSERSPSPELSHRNTDIRTRSPSPIIQEEKQDNTDGADRTSNLDESMTLDDSPALANHQSQDTNRERNSERSRSPSPSSRPDLNEDTTERPNAEDRGTTSPRLRSRSPSPVPQEEKHDDEQNIDLTAKHNEFLTSVMESFQEDRLASPSLERNIDENTDGDQNDEQLRDRSPSTSSHHDIDENAKESSDVQVRAQDSPHTRTRSPSPVHQEGKQGPEQSIDATGTQEEATYHDHVATPMKEFPQDVRPTSPSLPDNMNDDSHSDMKQHQERSRSPSSSSQLEINDDRRTQSPQIRSRSPSPISQGTEQDHEPNIDRTANLEESRKYDDFSMPEKESPREEDRPKSPNLAQNIKEHNDDEMTPAQQRDRSPSPALEKQHIDVRSRSPSPAQKSPLQRSRSPSPSLRRDIDENANEPSNAQVQTPGSPHARSRSPSPIPQEENQDHARNIDETSHVEQSERSRSPSPSSRPDPNGDDRGTRSPHRRSRSPSPKPQQEGEDYEHSIGETSTSVEEIPQEHIRPVSPTFRQDMTDEEQPQRSRSPSPLFRADVNQTLVTEDQRTPSPHTRSRSPSPIPQQENQDHESSIDATANHDEQTQHGGMASSPKKSPQEEDRPESPSLRENIDDETHGDVKHEERRERSPSPLLESRTTDIRSRSPSPIQTSPQQRSRSPSPSQREDAERNTDIGSNQEATTTELNPLFEPLIDRNDGRSRSPSPLRTASVTSRSRSPSPQLNRVEESPESLKSEERAMKNEPPSPMREHAEGRSRSPSPSARLNSEDNANGTATSENRRERSPSPTRAAEETRARSRSPSPVVRRTDGVETVRSRSPSPRTIQPNIDDDQVSIPATQSSPRRSRSPSPVQHQELRPMVSPMPIATQRQERSRSPSPKAHESDENESLSQTSPNHEREGQLERSSERRFSHENEHDQTINKNNGSSRSPSVDQLSHGEPIPMPLLNRQESLSRSQSQQSMTRPTTLPFSPNNHHLDGLYISNLSDDENEEIQENQYHPNSAPSTVSTEYPPLTHQQSEQKHSPVNPSEISKRLSIVEKSQREDADATNNVDTSHSKDT